MESGSGKNYIVKISKKIDTVDYGNKIKASFTYEKPSKNRNYLGFDYSKYLKSQNIYGTIYIKEKYDVVKEKDIDSLSFIIHNLKQKIIENIKSVIKEDVASGLLIGLLVGDTSYSEKQVILDFRDSSLSHMLAISGQHIGYILLALNLINKKNHIAKNLWKVLTIILLLLFMAVVGFTPSVTRAGIMCILILASSLLNRNNDVYTNMAFSALIILLFNPFSIFNMGFILSYTGTLGILLFSKVWKAKESKKKNESINDLEVYSKKNEIVSKISLSIKNMMKMCISAQVFLLPIMVYNFNTISLLFLISNIIASPLVAVIIIYGFIIFLVSLLSIKISSFLVIPLIFIIKLLIYFTKIISSFPLSTILLKTPSIFLIVLYYLFLIFVLIKIKNHKRLFEKKILTTIYKMWKTLVIFLLIVIFVLNVIPFFNDNLKIHFIDIGQGDSTLIITPKGKNILIDGGGDNSRKL